MPHASAAAQASAAVARAAWVITKQLHAWSDALIALDAAPPDPAERRAG